MRSKSRLSIVALAAARLANRTDGLEVPHIAHHRVLDETLHMRPTVRRLACLVTVLALVVVGLSPAQALEGPEVVGTTEAGQVFSVVAIAKDAADVWAQYVLVVWVKGDESQAWLAEFHPYWQQTGAAKILDSTSEGITNFNLDVAPDLSAATFDGTFPTLGNIHISLTFETWYPLYNVERHPGYQYRIELYSASSQIVRSGLINYSPLIEYNRIGDRPFNLIEWKTYGFDTSIAAFLGSLAP